jgi:hypothetical protein
MLEEWGRKADQGEYSSICTKFSFITISLCVQNYVLSIQRCGGVTPFALLEGEPPRGSPRQFHRIRLGLLCFRHLSQTFRYLVVLKALTSDKKILKEIIQLWRSSILESKLM